MSYAKAVFYTILNLTKYALLKTTATSGVHRVGISRRKVKKIGDVGRYRRDVCMCVCVCVCVYERIFPVKILCKVLCEKKKDAAHIAESVSTDVCKGARARGRQANSAQE